MSDLSDLPGRRDPRRRAVVLGDDRARDAALRVPARGRGEVAGRIVQLGEEHGVSIERDADLVSCLESIDAGAEIPLQAWTAVAEVLAFLYSRGR